MQGLFDRVIKGSYPRIPKKFSQDLSMVIKGLLQVKAKNRPTCDQLLSHPIITKRIKKLGLEEFSDESVLLKTIQPFNDKSSNIMYNLPAPAYTSTEANKFSKACLKSSKTKKSPYGDDYSDGSDAFSNDEGDLSSHKKYAKKAKDQKLKGIFGFLIV